MVRCGTCSTQNLRERANSSNGVPAVTGIGCTTSPICCSAEVLLEVGADCDYQAPNGDSPLGRLIKEGADVNRKDKRFNSSPLGAADSFHNQAKATATELSRCLWLQVQMSRPSGLQMRMSAPI